MSPFLRPGDRIGVYWFGGNCEPLRPGEIVIARGEKPGEEWIVHRVIETPSTTRTVTQGDAALAREEWHCEQIWGRIESIENRPYRARALDKLIAHLSRGTIPCDSLQARVIRKAIHALGHFRRAML